jgi:ComF family protein
VAHDGRLALRATGVHAGPLRAAIHRLKYGGEAGLAAELGSLVALELGRDLACGATIDAIVPVPLHRSRAAARGYDQAALLARAVAERAGLPLRPVLHRIHGGRPQVELDRAARSANIRGAFVAEARSLKGLRVALVDDVATTGATLADAAAAARSAGARAVRAYVVAIEE